MAVSLSFTRSHDAAFTYEQMRAVAKASVHDNTCAVAALPATATPDVWPGEPDAAAQRGAFGCVCGAIVPLCDVVGQTAHARCLECFITGRGHGS